MTVHTLFYRVRLVWRALRGRPFIELRDGGRLEHASVYGGIYFDGSGGNVVMGNITFEG